MAPRLPDLDDLAIGLVDEDPSRVVGGVSDALTVEPYLGRIKGRRPDAKRGLLRATGILPDEKETHDHDDHEAADEKTRRSGELGEPLSQTIPLCFKCLQRVASMPRS